MKRVRVCLIVAVFVSTSLISRPARAEILLIPWLSANTGTSGASGTIGFGASAGEMVAGVIGVEADFGYAPSFFGNGLNSYVLTTMGNVTVGIPFDRAHRSGIRPYLTGGLGLIRARLESPLYRFSTANNDIGLNYGGGLMAFLGEHVGVRADLRYIRSLEDDNSTNPFAQIDLSHLHYWRTSFGFVLR